MAWVEPALLFTGQIVQLRSLLPADIPVLQKIAGDKPIWQHYTFDGTDPKRFNEIYDGIFRDKEKGTQHPFAIVLKKEQKLIGSTRFLDIQPIHRKLEIGGTWLVPDYWATAVNVECKLILLTYCFERLNTVRVQLKTDVNNIRSRKAIEKIGGKYEGTLRNDMVRDNGSYRDSAYYSIIESEWGAAKVNLESLLKNKMNISH